MNKQLAMVAAAVAIMSLPEQADAQLFGKLLGVPPASVKAKYYRDDMIVADSSVKKIRLGPDLARDLAYRKLAEMARDRDYPRFGVIGGRCYAHTVGSATSYFACQIHVQMVREGEEVRERWRTKAEYYEVASLLGKLRPVEEMLAAARAE